MTSVTAKDFAALFVQCLRRFQADADAEVASVDPDKVGAAVAEALREQQPGPKYPPLDQISSEFVGTECAAYHLNRRPQTLRWWHHQGCGPIRAIRKHGRLSWPVEGIRRYLAEGRPNE